MLHCNFIITNKKLVYLFPYENNLKHDFINRFGLTMGECKTKLWKPIRNRIYILFTYMANDWWQIILSGFFIGLLGIFAYVFKKDKMGIQAFRAFDLEDKTLQYEHSPSVISGDMNIFLSTVYGVSLNYRYEHFPLYVSSTFSI